MWSRTVSVIDMFISAPHSQIHTWLEIYHTRKHVARLRMRPRRAREAIMRIRIPSNKKRVSNLLYANVGCMRKVT